MKNSFYIFVLLSTFVSGQVNYPKQNIELLSLSKPDTGIAHANSRRYSGCWGWYQQSKNKEYAICGTAGGTYFLDITNPVTPTISAFVRGKQACGWREMKTYQNYCYIISDDPAPNKFQIVDMQYLPDSVHIVHDGSSYFERGHTIWIDNDKMYIGAVTYTSGFSPMNIYSLATPSVPVLLRELQEDIPLSLINYVHDMHVRNDTVYASCGFEGLYILKYNNTTNTFNEIGSYSGYASGPAYNHSSFLTQNGKQLVFCDEIPVSMPIRIVDVQNLGNIQELQAFKPFSSTTPHNPYIVGNNFAVVSCYRDGLYIYDISQQGNVIVAGYFDTHPQTVFTPDDEKNYRGNWGAYPWLPSKIIIAQDMQNGVFLLDASKAYTNRVSIQTNALSKEEPEIYPNPASNRLTIQYQSPERSSVHLESVLGQIVFQKNYAIAINETIDLDQFKSGTYMLSITNSKKVINKKVVICR